MPKVSQERIKYLWTISSIIGITIIAVGIVLPLLGLYIQSLLLFTAIFTPTDFFVLGLLVIITPPASAYFVDARWRNGIDNNLPQLLRDISDAQRTGLSLPRAILESAKREYGPLTAELQKMAAKISWGVSFREAMQALSETADTPLVRRASVLILEAERFGGAAEDVFESAHTHVVELLTIRRERAGQIRPYIFIIYAAFLVFLFVCIVLITTFFGPMATQAGAGLFALAIDIEYMNNLFLHMLVVEGFFGGLVAGKMGEAELRAGLKHSVLLVAAGWIIFRVVIILGITLM
ncbi:MAG: type II secretion system F family protein [Candidatus Sifarchaeia archaeon]|jgi:flagellar protein FlaJ